jgi:hypothetical protein
MSGAELGDWRSVLSEGDRRLYSGDLTAAGQAYRLLFDNLAGSTPTRSADSVLMAAITHRVAVVEYVAGDHWNAGNVFADVDRVLDGAILVAADDETRQYITAVREQSHVHRRLLEDTDDWRNQVVMFAVCRHGCPSIITDCGQSASHC